MLLIVVFPLHPSSLTPANISALERNATPIVFSELLQAVSQLRDNPLAVVGICHHHHVKSRPTIGLVISMFTLFSASIGAYFAMIPDRIFSTT